MASLKIIRKRRASVKNTQKVTKAMKLVAAAKLRRAQQSALASRAYVDGLNAIVSNVASRMNPESAPLLMRAGQNSKTLLVLLTSDRGLCGGFNENLVRGANDWLKQQKAAGIPTDVLVLGRKGVAALSRLKIAAEKRTETLPENNPESLVQLLAPMLTERFVSGNVGKIVVGYNRFISAGRQQIAFEQLLPFETQQAATSFGVEYLYEPEREAVLNTLIEQAFTGFIRQAFLDSRASELASRMQAMDNATKNAQEMIEKLSLQYNRARQATITGELLDILGGAAALNG